MEAAKMKTVVLRLLIVIALFFISAVVAYNVFYEEEKLPVLTPGDIDPRLVDESLKYSFKNHQIGDFKLINQDGDTVTQKDFEQHIYVANFIFTTCPGICPIMTKKMEKVYQHFYDLENFSIISHSVTPEIDSVPS